MCGQTSVVIATHNPGKMKEFAELLIDLGVTARALQEFPDAPRVSEDAPSYLENARAKAQVIARHVGLPALADDSGLEVDALAGAPGVRSARFAGEPADDRRNIALLLQRLEDVPRCWRRARFCCVIVVARPDGATLSAEGSCEGVIAPEPVGAGGFGYDPVFLVPSLGRTFAQLSAAEKHRFSHRGLACANLRLHLLSFLQVAPQSA